MIAVIITIMALEMKVPHGGDVESLKPAISLFLSYVPSFIYAGIYRSNHHHLFHAARHLNGPIVWANLATQTACLRRVRVRKGVRG